MDLTVELTVWLKHHHEEEYTIPKLVVLVLNLRVLQPVGRVNHVIVDVILLETSPILGGLQSVAKRGGSKSFYFCDDFRVKSTPNPEIPSCLIFLCNSDGSNPAKFAKFAMMTYHHYIIM